MAKKARDEGKASSLTDKRIKLLEKVGFVWGKQKGRLWWKKEFLELQKYYQENGHCKFSNLPYLLIERFRSLT